MILIADSGSTKTEWRVLNAEKPTKIILGQGLNPYYQNESEMTQNLHSDLKDIDNLPIQKIYFYGAGCNHETKNNQVRKSLLAVFQEINQKNIFVNNDLLGAGKSLVGDSEGIICILGTGANACFYDGQDFPNYQSALGFLLGDEGSGSYLGKLVIQAFLRNELPDNLMVKFNQKYNLSRSELIQNVYQATFPNRYLATFTYFLAENIENLYVQNLIEKGFNLFFEKTVCKLENYQKHPLYFMGSVAFYFQKILTKVADKHQVTIQKILKKPSNNLEKYHRKELKNI